MGHTHEDIDAQFARLSELLRTNDAVTIPGLQQIVGTSELTRGLFDMKTWISPALNNIKKHSKPLHFLFTKADDDSVAFQYKSSCNQTWFTHQGPGVLSYTPEGIPPIVIPPNFDKINLHQLSDNIKRHTHCMSERQQGWWIRFVAEIKRIQENPAYRNRYAEYNAVWVFPMLRNKMYLRPAKNAVIRPHLLEMMDKELDCHEVC